MDLVRRAAFIAGSYILLAGAWILGSGAVASAVATDAAELERLERLKGLGFVASTGLLLFLASWVVLKRLTAELGRAAKARETMLQLERHSLAGLFVSSIAHDANNVAAVVKAALFELHKKQKLDDDGQEAVRDAEEALGKLEQLFTDLKGLGRADAPRKAEVRELVSTVEHATTLLHGHSLVKHCKVRVVADGPLEVPIVPSLVDQLLINLLINAADATNGRGTIEVRVRKEGGDAVLEVHDDGPGVPPELEPQLFGAFKTTKAHGTGLGLMSVKECAARHRGSVSYQRSPLGGACFTVRLPLTAA